ncbi:MAG: sigma-70 family RNA polymerase sigma factor [bacterium]|nr:sigma-70 family RNA polymerase sigma factor [bacterium]
MNNIIDAQNGDETAFAELVKQNLPLIYRYIFRLTGNVATAEDLTQETFVRVWKNLSRFDTKKPFRPWLYRIARNCAFDFLRKKNTVPFSYLSEQEQLKLGTLPDNSTSPADARDSTSQIVLLTTDTTYEKTTTATQGDFQTSASVVINGKSNPDGSVTATSVQTAPANLGQGQNQGRLISQ